MTKLPPILIVTDRGHFVAYKLLRGSVPAVLDHATFSEGVDKLSEQVTDKAGGFPNGGSAGHGNSAAERMTLVAELEMRCFRHIGDHISKVLEANPGTWGFAAPAEINSAILDQVPKPHLERMTLNLRKDLARVPATDVVDHFVEAAA